MIHAFTALVIALLMTACAGPERKSPLEKVEGGYSVHLEKNPLDMAKVNGRSIDLIVMDLGPLANATTREDTLAYVDEVMNQDKHVRKVTGVASMSSPYVLTVRTEGILEYTPSRDQALYIDLHDAANTAQHPNLHGTLGCGSCLLLNRFKLIYTTCLTGDRARCATCVSCDLLP